MNTAEYQASALERRPQVRDTSNLSHEYLSLCLGSDVGLVPSQVQYNTAWSSSGDRFLRK